MWFNDAIIYHLYAMSFTDFRNEGQQGHKFDEIAKWIPHIKSLGCNAVLFSPVLKSLSHGYDVTDYFEIDNRLGTNGEFRALVDEFHANGIRVVVDCVFNHCGRDFFAFKELQNGNRGYAGWFAGVDFNQRSPLGDNFTYQTWSGYFELVKFNLYNENVCKHLLDAAKFWIDAYDIDGMRLDSANVLDFNFMRNLRYATTGQKSDFWLMGEVVGGDYPRWVNPDGLHSVTNYILFKALFSSHNDNNMYELAHTLKNSAPQGGLPLYNFLDNHDQPRIASAVRHPGFLKTLYTLLFTLPGIPSIYYGSEWGLTGVKENGSDAPVRPHIDIIDPPQNTELVALIRKLAKIRQSEKALRYGGYREVYLAYQKPFVFERFHEGEFVTVAININDWVERVQGKGTDLLTGETFFGEVPLSPYSSRILK